MIQPHSMTIPEDVRSIHLIAICGTGMGALACLLKESGYAVTGSDQHVYAPISDFLNRHSIPIHIGYRAENLSPRPDLVVVGNAVSKDNPEVMAMLALGLPYCSMPQAINRFAARGKAQIVITGTHGKTTTSSFIAWLLTCAGLDPSFLIGGIVSNFDSNFRTGQGPWIVLEGDEYDTAFFDKGSKFLHYTPEVAVLTSIEFDHADIFKDLEHVKSAFRALIDNLAPHAQLIAYDQDANIDAILSHAGCAVVRYGQAPGSALTLGKVTIEPPVTRFEVCSEGTRQDEFKTSMIGRHNLMNLLAGIAVGRRLGLDRATISYALESFKGVRRRQQVRGIKRDVVVIDDFAHHPTAVRETVGAVKSFYQDRRVVAVFEPRTNSSRRSIFQSAYASSFDRADRVCVRQAPMLEKIAPEERFSSEQLVKDLRGRGRDAFFFADTDEMIRFLVDQSRPGDVLLIMSNGGFDNIHERLLALL
jgi:UDP-N-acetylmuramate: L-alanyl-gamma-D-glutamyl-meso-diaminopimelate ligase